MNHSFTAEKPLKAPMTINRHLKSKQTATVLVMKRADKEIAQTIKLGNETKTAGDIPQIESVSQPQTLAGGETSAFIHAQNVVDTNGIQEVFAVITPPDYSSGSPDNPVTDLPTINLAAVGNNSYSGTCIMGSRLKAFTTLLYLPGMGKGFCHCRIKPL